MSTNYLSARLFGPRMSGGLRCEANPCLTAKLSTTDSRLVKKCTYFLTPKRHPNGRFKKRIRTLLLDFTKVPRILGVSPNEQTHVILWHGMDYTRARARSTN